MKPLTQMNNRELFSVLAGDDVIQQAYLQKILRLYLQATQKQHFDDDVDLKTIVKDFSEGKFGELPED